MRLFIASKIILALCILGCSGVKDLCEIDSEQWRTDECGSNGYKSKAGDCIFEKSQTKPLIKKEKDVLKILGKPDTIFINNDSEKHYYYVTIGPGFNEKCYNGGMLKTLQFFINKKGKVTSISGGIH